MRLSETFQKSMRSNESKHETAGSNGINKDLWAQKKYPEACKRIVLFFYFEDLDQAEEPNDLDSSSPILY